jgi:hypothetical protein
MKETILYILPLMITVLFPPLSKEKRGVNQIPFTPLKNSRLKERTYREFKRRTIYLR